jgi:signal peptidase I
MVREMSMMSLRKWLLLSVVFATLGGCNNNWSSGDRVLVSKCAYDNGLTGPHRFDVVVFKWPGDKPGNGPVENNTPKNYIKRLLGLPGELLAIMFGRIYRWAPPPNAPPPYDDVKNPEVNRNNLWTPPFMHQNEDKARAWFKNGQFEIVRKPPHVMLALRRIVYDNDFQAKDLKGKLDRWSPAADSGWQLDGPTGFAFSPAEGKAKFDWLRYQHLLRPDDGRAVGQGRTEPRLITDSLAYNNHKVIVRNRNDKDDKGHVVDKSPSHPHWVGDLMIECNVEVVEPKGEFCLELSKGIYRYQACWDLSTGQCTLSRAKEGNFENPEKLAVKETSVKSAGKYLLRFANVDARLTVWVDRALPFGDGEAYDPPELRQKTDKDDDACLERRGPRDNDLQPASLGGKGANLKVTHLRLWRDTYYVTDVNPGKDYDMPADAWSDPSKWEPIRKASFNTMYVQPGHYLCLGDNSQASSDSRQWGTVPERLMLGRALVVYYPLDRIGLIR